MSNENNKKFENLFKSVSNQLGKSPEELKQASQNGDIENLLENLNPSDAQKIKKILANKNMANKILATPQAQNLIKKLLGES